MVIIIYEVRDEVDDERPDITQRELCAEVVELLDNDMIDDEEREVFVREVDEVEREASDVIQFDNNDEIDDNELNMI